MGNTQSSIPQSIELPSLGSFKHIRSYTDSRYGSCNIYQSLNSLRYIARKTLTDLDKEIHQQKVTIGQAATLLSHPNIVKIHDVKSENASTGCANSFKTNIISDFCLDSLDKLIQKRKEYKVMFREDEILYVAHVSDFLLLAT